jgi:AcrR family transcriptional regulator
MGNIPDRAHIRAREWAGSPMLPFGSILACARADGAVAEQTPHAGLTGADWRINNWRMAARETGQRATAEDRRDEVLEAAIHEFAEFGFHAAKTANIAKRAGISQPYIYALFADKKALFLACLGRVRVQIRDAFCAAWQPGATLEESLTNLGRNYRTVLINPDAPRCQIQGYAASSDPDIREFMRRGYLEVFDLVRELTGADQPTVARFMATGNLLNVGALLGLPDEYTFAPLGRLAD